MAAAGAGMLHYGSAHAGNGAAPPAGGEGNGSAAPDPCTEAGYCTLALSVCLYIVGYAPILFRSFSADTDALRSAELKAALRAALLPLMRGSESSEQPGSKDDRSAALDMEAGGMGDALGAPLLRGDMELTGEASSEVDGEWLPREIAALLERAGAAE